MIAKTEGIKMIMHKYCCTSKLHSAGLRQSGFSLVELMVGLVIGLIASLVIMQVFSAFEGQKRSTSGTADAQTNASIALHHIQRDMQMAGFGIPLAQPNNEKVALKCEPDLFDHDGDGGLVTPPLGLFPLVVEDAANGSVNDIVTIRYSQQAIAPIPVKIGGGTTTSKLKVDNTISCQKDDIVLIQSAAATCSFAKIDTVDAADKSVTLSVALAAVPSGVMTCMGQWQDYTYAINVNNELTLNGTPIVSEIVNIQAQYGVSDSPDSNKVTSWQSAVGVWAAPTMEQRNTIKALRIVVVARNNLLEKEVVTDEDSFDPALGIDLSDIENWQNYRYKAFETIIPLRNIIWSRKALES